MKDYLRYYLCSLMVLVGIAGFVAGGWWMLAGLGTFFVLAAVAQRERTGKGRLVEVAMVEAVYSCLATGLDQYMRAGKKVPARSGNAFGRCLPDAQQHVLLASERQLDHAIAR